MSESRVIPIASETNDVELLKDEAGGLMQELGVTTTTFFKGDFAGAASALRDRLALVVAANPWLAGRIVKGEKAGSLVLRHSTSPSSAEIDDLFQATASTDADPKAFKFSPSMPYLKMCTGMYKAKPPVAIGTGYSLVGKPVPVTLLSVVESEPGNFALIFSMSHVVADGRTYYEIYKMLSPGGGGTAAIEIRSLDSKRIHDFPEKMRDAYNRKALEWADSVPAGLLFMTSLMCSSGTKCHAFHLDEEKVAAAKTKGAQDGGVEYVTTNDVLTSAFFNVTNCRIGWMGFDCRDKLEGFGSNLAGNYVTALVIDPEVYETPASLRNMYKGYETTKQKLPGCCCNPSNFGMVTNWSSFAGSLVSIEGCERLIHLPVLNPAYCVFDLMIPFATGMGEGKKGVICWTTTADEDMLRAALPVGETMSLELFPKK